ncbi:MAG: ABC transporter permease [Lachnospiraceae bacterium]|nr:ABC transporter permease [Lachnospiraceae bacterium]
MYRLFVIAKNNIKKQSGDMITFFILTALTTLLIFMAVSSFGDINTVYNRRFEEINGAELLLAMPCSENSKKCMEEALRKKGLTEYELSDIISLSADYKNSKKSEYVNYSFLAESFDDDPTMMKVVDKSRGYKKNDILIPLMLKPEFEVGDIFELRIGEKEYSLKVAGYTENPFFCSNISVNIIYIYLSEDMMNLILSDAGPSSYNVTKKGLYKIGTDDSLTYDRNKLATYEKDIVNEYNSLMQEMPEKQSGGDSSMLTINWGLIHWGNKMLPQLVMAIIIVFAMIILAIAIIILAFSVSNFINKNIKNFAILEASGYTVKELKGALTVQIVLIGLLGAAAGALAGIAMTSSWGAFVESLLGIGNNASVNIPAAFIVVAAMAFVIFVAVRFMARKFDKISVLDALRGGISNHNYKRNRFSFEKTHLPVPIVLSLKETFGSIGKNILLLLITAILTISTLLGFGLMENFGGDSEGAISIMGFEFGDVILTGKSGLEDELRKFDMVDNVLCELDVDMVIEYNGKSEKYNTIINDGEKYAINKVIIEGRFPEKDNEIMLTSIVAETLGVKTGDVVSMANGNTKKDFIVCGMNQRMQNAGQTLTILFSGAERLGLSTDVISYYVTFKEGVTYDEFVSRIRKYEKENDLSFNIVNSHDMMGATIDGMTSAMGVICVVFSMLTVIVVIFVESLLIRAKINREWRDMGVSKALGMSSRELGLQIALSNIPVILFGTMIGAMLAGEAGKSVVKLAFYYMGIQRIEFSISFVWTLVVMAGIVAVAFLTSAMAGRRVKRIIPVEMITEE